MSRDQALESIVTADQRQRDLSGVVLRPFHAPHDRCDTDATLGGYLLDVGKGATPQGGHVERLDL
jgi:hypothetical protein